jgi:hypothetical protein
MLVRVRPEAADNCGIDEHMLELLVAEILVENPGVDMADAIMLAKYEYQLGRRPADVVGGSLSKTHPEELWKSWSGACNQARDTMQWRQDAEKYKLGHEDWMSLVHIDNSIDLVAWLAPDSMYGWRVIILSDNTVVWPKNPFNPPRSWVGAVICHKAVGLHQCASPSSEKTVYSLQNVSSAAFGCDRLLHLHQAAVSSAAPAKTSITILAKGL